MSLLTKLNDARLWRAFYEYKLERLPKREAEALLAFIQREGYREIAEHIADAGFCFAPPVRREISRHGNGKKRVVYAFTEAENYVLKLLAYQLYQYDAAFSPNCYSFRRDTGARQAIARMCSLRDEERRFGYKLDIHDYFNSIDVSLLLPMLRDLLADDAPLYAFLARLLTADEAIRDGVPVHEKRGVMAGTPISPFLANLYLADMDAHFASAHAAYARYSDDILVFAPDEERLHAYQDYILQTLRSRNLAVNPDKECFIQPGETWTFLGVRYENGSVGLSATSRDKLMGKIRRKARALHRWGKRKNASDTQVMRAFIRAVNRKLFDEPDANALTWTRWFFPLLTNDGDLKALDAYIQDSMRYAATGRHCKGNYAIRYDTLKACGYRSLVNAYYRYKNGEEVW